MKQIIPLLLFLSSSLVMNGQCSSVSVQISSSDTSYIQLYHAGFFNIPSGYANVCNWEVVDFLGEIIYQDTTSGGAFEQGQVLFNHSVPITDSLKATVVITNTVEGIICTLKDTLYWKETEVLPGSFIGNWDVLSGSGGIEEELVSSDEIANDKEEIKLFPSPALEYFQIAGIYDKYSFSISNLNGQILETFKNIPKHHKVDISSFPSGVYIVNFKDYENNSTGVKKVIKK